MDAQGTITAPGGLFAADSRIWKQPSCTRASEKPGLSASLDVGRHARGPRFMSGACPHNLLLGGATGVQGSGGPLDPSG